MSVRWSAECGREENSRVIEENAEGDEWNKTKQEHGFLRARYLRLCVI
jgi:hypothetical protein